MSYIIERNSPLILTKLTDNGRKNIARGTYNIRYFSIGDSEVNYGEVYDERLFIQKPKDRNPLQKFFIQKDFECNSIIPINDADINIVNGIVKNKARDRGFFDGKLINNTTLQTSDEFIKFSGQIPLDRFDGTKILDITDVFSEDEYELLSDGDIILFKFFISTTGETITGETQTPVPYLFFSVEKDGALPQLRVDRFLPFYSYISGASETLINFYVYPNINDTLDFYSPSGRTITWNGETLDFYEQCDLNDVHVWNMNIPYCEDYMGTTGCTESYKDYHSQSYAGSLTYFDYCKDCLEDEIISNNCKDDLLSVRYLRKNQAGIIHFSNYNTRNQYGEFLFIDNTNHEFKFRMILPTIMWHRSSSSDLMGLSVESTGELKYLDVLRNNIDYYDLIDDARYLPEGTVPKVVGKVFPSLKIAIIEDSELLAAMSYKSNRNWTLPELKGKMIFPVAGNGNGILKKDKRLYMTYMLKASNGIMHTFPQQNLIYFENRTEQDRDIEFQLENTGFLPFMRNIEATDYDYTGFYAHKFIVLYQIVDAGQAPNYDAWQMVDFTSNNITNLPTNTIVPSLLESQNPYQNQFVLSPFRAEYDALGIYSNTYHCIGCESTFLNMGGEQFFFGNVQTYIGASIYRWIANLKIDPTYIKTTNTTYTDGDFFLTEISFYNENKEQMCVSKLSRPVKLRNNTITEVEVSIDF